MCPCQELPVPPGPCLAVSPRPCRPDRPAQSAYSRSAGMAGLAITGLLQPYLCGRKNYPALKSPTHLNSSISSAVVLESGVYAFYGRCEALIRTSALSYETGVSQLIVRLTWRILFCFQPGCLPDGDTAKQKVHPGAIGTAFDREQTSLSRTKTMMFEFIAEAVPGEAL
jgi:hypothetical protein